MVYRSKFAGILQQLSPAVRKQFARSHAWAAWALAALVLANLPLGAARAQCVHGTQTVDVPGTVDRVSGSAVDGSGGLFLCGDTVNKFLGVDHQDAWVARLDAQGAVLWVVTLASSFIRQDTAARIIPDPAGGVYVCGETNGDLAGSNPNTWNGWVARLNGVGNVLWIKNVGLAGDNFAHGLAQDGSGGLFVTGRITLSGGTDLGAFVMRLDSSGLEYWSTTINTPVYDVAYAASSDGAGGVYVAGTTDGALGGGNLGETDTWLARLNGAGATLWTRQLGSPGFDLAFDVQGVGQGGVYLAGSTSGDLGGPNMGGFDGYVARYSEAGDLVWLEQIGGESIEEVYALTTNEFGDAIAVGNSHLYGGWARGYNLAGSLKWQFSQQPQDVLWREVAFVSPPIGFILGNNIFTKKLQKTQLNVDASYCSSVPSSSGCQPALSALGTPSLSQPANFTVRAAQLERNKNGLMFFGTSGPSDTPFYGGKLCVAPPTYRLPVKGTGGGANCAGTLNYSLAEFLAHPQGGTLVGSGFATYCQAWTRDPDSPNGVSLSNGLYFAICP